MLAAFYTDEVDGFSSGLVQAHPRLGTITAFQSDKQLGAASGSWSLTVKKARQTPDSALRAGPRGLWRDPEDVWVRIKVVVDGQIIDTVLGLVDSVAESVMRSGSGARNETYTITGRDIGKIFETTELFVNFFHDPSRPLRAQGAVVATLSEQLVGTPAHFVRVLLETWLGNDGAAETPWLMPQGLGGGPFFSPAIVSSSGLAGSSSRLTLEGAGMTGIQAMRREENGEAIAPTLMQIDQAGGKLWDTMQEWSNGTLNEMWVDLAPASGAGLADLESLVPTLTLRERPFPTREEGGRTTNHTKWDQLLTHTLELGDVKDRKVSKGGAGQRFNYWKLQISGMGSEGFNVDEILQRGVDGVESGHPGNIPIFNTDSIARHGVRMYNQTTKFIPFLYRTRADEADGDAVREQSRLGLSFFQIAAGWLKKLHDWFVIAPYELSGTLTTTRMMPEIRVGQRLREQRLEGNIMHYVEAVSHSWQYPNAGSSTITVTRGEYEDDDLLEYVYAQYEQPRTLSQEELCPEVEGQEFDLVERLISGACRYTAVIDDADGTRRGLEEEFTTTIDDNAQLEVERDGTTARASDAGDETALDDSNPQQADAETAPGPGAAQDANDMQGAVERGEPLPLLEGLDFADNGDPIGGIESGSSLWDDT